MTDHEPQLEPVTPPSASFVEIAGRALKAVREDADLTLGDIARAGETLGYGKTDTIKTVLSRFERAEPPLVGRQTLENLLATYATALGETRAALLAEIAFVMAEEDAG